MAKRILIAQCVLLVAAAVGLFVKEYPGLLREIKIWRMAALSSAPGARHAK